jgi:hypothetical protein
VENGPWFLRLTPKASCSQQQYRRARSSICRCCSQLSDFLPQAQVLGLKIPDLPILFETIADGAIYGIMNAPDQVCFCVAHGVVSKPILGDNMAE